MRNFTIPTRSGKSPGSKIEGRNFLSGLVFSIYYRNIAIYNIIMGVSKTQLFDQRQNEIASVAKVLAHPARVAILQHISQQDDCICSDLVVETGLAQATISQHLKEIKLLHGNFQGKNLCYCIDKERWDELQELFNSFFKRIGQQCC